MRKIAAGMAACALAVTAGLWATAEVPRQTPEQLKANASHIVTGEVLAVYSYDEKDGESVTGRHVAEIKVDAVEKGEGLAVGQVVYVRLWTTKARPKGWVGSIGHSVPKPGDAVRAHVTRGDDAKLDSLLPNGVEKK
jgi:predicted RecA/RadA family phage recombinase